MAVTGTIYRAVQYSPAGKHVGSSTLTIRESEDKIKKAKGNSLKWKKKL